MQPPVPQMGNPYPLLGNFNGCDASQYHGRSQFQRSWRPLFDGDLVLVRKLLRQAWYTK